MANKTKQKEQKKPNEAFDFKGTCIECQAKCCHGDMVIATEVEYLNIIGSGAEDHFRDVEVEGKRFYVLDFEADNAACSYLNDDKTCSIESDKPNSCRIFPAVPNAFGLTDFSKNCPATPHLNDAFKRQASQMLFEIRWGLNGNGPKIIQAYEEKYGL